MADPAFDIVYASSGNSDVAAGGTITFQYPVQRAAASYIGESPAYLGVRYMQGIYTENVDFTVNYGGTNVVVTWLGATTIPMHKRVFLQMPLRDTSGLPVGPGLGVALPDSIQPAGN